MSDTADMTWKVQRCITASAGRRTVRWDGGPASRIYPASCMSLLDNPMSETVGNVTSEEKSTPLNPHKRGIFDRLQKNIGAFAPDVAGEAVPCPYRSRGAKAGRRCHQRKNARRGHGFSLNKVARRRVDDLLMAGSPIERLALAGIALIWFAMWGGC